MRLGWSGAALNTLFLDEKIAMVDIRKYFGINNGYSYLMNLKSLFEKWISGQNTVSKKSSFTAT